MAEFIKAYHDWVEPNEGGFSNIKEDKGGFTYAGISQKFWPKWEGWPIVEFEYKNGRLKQGQKIPTVTYLVKDFYEKLWKSNNFHLIHNQNVANIAFDWFVNSGASSVRTNSKETYGIDEILIEKFDKKIPVDSKFDITTINAINSVNPDLLYNEIKKQRIDFYKSLIKKDPTQKKFEKTWMNRISRFPTIVADKKLGLIVLAIVTIYLLNKN